MTHSRIRSGASAPGPLRVNITKAPADIPARNATDEQIAPFIAFLCIYRQAPRRGIQLLKVWLNLLIIARKLVSRAIRY